ncbi:hypothetical protein NDU88_004704 [Pleurodeles waltl]|uniref:Uncharacterized protein n=1 Tax=Pleurodeles waltl TaxID=8319 RepID=A0AAV7TS12_PLEWA|nr:hypothetical protein NDU88_004704 [Pleurodeles waltl]
MSPLRPLLHRASSGQDTAPPSHGHRWAPGEPFPHKQGNRGAVARGSAATRRPQAAESHRGVRGAAPRRARPCSGAAVPECKKLPSVCFRHYPRGRGSPTAVTSSPGAAPLHVAEPRKAAPGSR